MWIGGHQQRTPSTTDNEHILRLPRELRSRELFDHVCAVFGCPHHAHLTPPKRSPDQINRRWHTGAQMAE